MKFISILLTALAFNAMAPRLGAQPIIVTEIMYHPPGTNLLEQWFEIGNVGSTAVDLSDWRVTKGVAFTFPANTVILAGSYLVVASDGPTFAEKHPDVTNFVAGWTGKLGHSLEIADDAGRVVNTLEFYDQGDWATRVLGANGIVGAVDHYGGLGWEWFAPHDGHNASLELMNALLPNTYAHNWTSSSVAGGTPGQANSTAVDNSAPFIAEVEHSPVIPRPADSVAITARIVDEESGGLTVTLRWRVDGAASFNTTVMLEDGAHGDGLAADGIYGAILPAQPNTTVVEFYLEARDAANHLCTYPHWMAPNDSPRTANLLYQVDDGNYAGAQPVYRLIMTEAERAYLENLSDHSSTTDSDATMNATWISTDGVMANGTTTQRRYNVGVRNRGHGTRTSRPHNFHVNIPSDRPWKKQSGINLNEHYAYSQVLGSAIFRRLGVPAADSCAVQVRVNSTNQMDLPLPDVNSFGSYAANEQYNNDFVQRTWPQDPGGNSYRAIRDPAAGINSEADLTWHDANYAQAVYTNAYFKQNNFLENDWSDLIRLLGVLNEVSGYSSAATYVEDVPRVLNVDEWMKYMAINTLLDNTETCLANGEGDDYALYRGTHDTRFQVLPYDMDSILGRGLSVTSPRDGLWRMTALSVMDRFMKTPAFVPAYFRWLKTLAETTFSSAQMDPLIDQVLGAYVPQKNRDNMKAFNASHVAYVLSQIPLSLTVATNLSIPGGYPYTTTPSLSLNGTANAIDTRRVLVQGNAAAYSAWQGTWSISSLPLHPGINRLLVQALGTNDVEVGRAIYDVWYDDGNVATVDGSVSADTSWTAAAGPYSVASSVTVHNGATLTIEAGTTLYLGSGVDITVANGGRLVAQGTSNAPIRLTTLPGSGARWGGITINGGTSSPETVLSHVHFEFNGATAIHSAGGSLILDHLTFGSTDHQYVSLDNSSFIVSDCLFPTPTSAFEPAHGSGGIKNGGHGLFIRNYFGAPNGYNDVIDFTGGNRNLGQPIVQFIHNVFAGGSDDVLDLDGTDAWVEGNIFLHVHRNGSPDSASAVSGGNNGSDTSEITILGNLFYDCDQVATAKQGNFYALINNTIVHQTHLGSQDAFTAVASPGEEGVPPGAGMYWEGNIIVDAEALVRNYNPAASQLTFTNNLMPFEWTGPGGNNSPAAPRLKYLPQLDETYFASFQEAQIMREWFSLQPGSPAIGTGPNGRDQGGVVPLGCSLSGEPLGTNNLTTTTLTVGVGRSGHGMPTAGWPGESGYTHYRFRLDDGAWSDERSITMPIAISGLTQGPHRVEATGRRDTGDYQDDTMYGPDAAITSSCAWLVDTGYVPLHLPTVRLNEVLAANRTTLTNAGTTPDLIELYNYGSVPVDLSGMGLTDNADQPYKFTFPPHTTLATGAVLVLYADSAFVAPGVHLGFSLKAAGDDVYLRARTDNGGALIDSVSFGLQLADYSIGRMPDDTWVLCRPTLGAANIACPMGNFWTLKINEWLADAQFAAKNDFVELYNPDAAPVLLGGLFLSDAAGAPDRNRIAPLSFIAGQGLASFIADGDPGQGADHLDFKLSPDVGLILLSAPNLTLIDAINYGPQRTDVSQGRSPDGSDTLSSFAQPTSGSPNPGLTGIVSVTNVTALVHPLLEVTSSRWRWDNSGTDRGTAWRESAFDDTAWSSGFGLFGRETTPAKYPYSFQTAIPAPSQSGGHLTVYYRAHFTWDGSLTNFQLLATNYVDDGAVYYLNGVEVGRLRITANPVLFTSTAGDQPNEGQAEILVFSTNSLAMGDNVLSVEVHQVNTSSSDDVFGLSLSAVTLTTNIIVQDYGVSAVLNEVLVRNQSVTNHAGHAVGYVELFNPSTNAIDLEDCSLSNDPGNPRKWLFAANTLVGPLAYLVVYCDEAAPVSPTNTGFALNTRGDTLYLFNKLDAGGALLDAVKFGVQIPDHAIGRLPNGTGNWMLTVPTVAAPNAEAGLGNISALRFNEWMADPASGADWFEIFNTGNQPVALGGLFLTDNLIDKTQSPIEPLSFIGAGVDAYVQFIADSQASAGADHVSFALKKTGESIGLFSSSGDLLDGVTFGPQVVGVSQGRLPDGANTLVSFPDRPSPGEANYLLLTDAVINEVLTQADPPLEEAVELANLTASPVNLSGWYLSNSRDNFKKLRIPDGTILPANGFLVFYETNFNTGPNPFTFDSAHGERAILSQVDALGNLTGYRSEVKYGAAENGVSFGRYQTSSGVEFTALADRTFGQDDPETVGQFRTGAGLPNAAPKVGPVVISEIFYSSLTDGFENAEDEFIELANISSTNVALFDPFYPTNPWGLRDAVDFSFPTNLTLAPGSRLLIVGFSASDPELLAAFRSKFDVPVDVPILGPWSGRLATDSDSVELVKPDAVLLPPHPDTGFVPQVLVDKVHYQTIAPWPTAALTGSNSLQRLSLTAYGNDPTNWVAAAPTPGRSITDTDFVDTDGDGMDDPWEMTYFQTLARDGSGDFDGDGMTDRGEYLAGTNPTNPSDALRVLSITYASPASLTFVAVAGRIYTVQYCDSLLSGVWQKLADVPAQTSTGPFTVIDLNPTNHKCFYRVQIP